jgi:hypothetical protein
LFFRSKFQQAVQLIVQLGSVFRSLARHLTDKGFGIDCQNFRKPDRSPLGQFVGQRARAGYTAYVAAGVGEASIWGGLRHQVFLGGEGVAERHADSGKPPGALREVRRAQRRSLAKPLDWFERRYPGHREAMARAFGAGVYTMQEIADHFGVHDSTVSRAVRWLEADSDRMLAWKTPW